MLLLSKEIERYVKDYTSPASPLLEELEKETYKRTTAPQMLTGKVEGKFLHMLVRISGAKRVVEIGTFTGYSALMMAEGLPEDGELITCEISSGYAAIAQSYFDRSPYGNRIHLKLGPAIETLRQISENSTDFIFIDADKSSYPAYYEESVRILKKGGLIAADNVLWSGRVLNPSAEDNETRGIVAFNRKVKSDKRVEKVMLTIRDGVYLIRKQ
jgi:caffeoyl-CoA O-methyltransferase